MRSDVFFLALTLITTAAAGIIETPRLVPSVDAVHQSEGHDHFKRKGGGGAGGRGGGGGSAGKGGGRVGIGGSSGSTGKGGPDIKGPNSNLGGATRGGSGPPPAYGGGRYYGGGSTRPYAAGRASPVGGILPLALLGAGIAFWPGVWLWGAYAYPYHNPYVFHNYSSNMTQSIPVVCGCAMYSECGCDENNSTAYYESLVGNGSYDGLNKSVVNVALYHGLSTLLINGTLPNGTTANDPDASTATALRSTMEMLGFWPVAAAVVVTILM